MRTAPDALTIGAYAFYSSKLTTIELPARTKSVGAYAFAKTSKVTAVSLGGASVIGERAFYSCGNWSGFALGDPRVRERRSGRAPSAVRLLQTDLCSRIRTDLSSPPTPSMK